MGHYTVPLLPCNVARVEKILLMDASKAPDTVALKLHRQFAHPSTEKLIQLIKDSQRDAPQLLKSIGSVTDNCAGMQVVKTFQTSPHCSNVNGSIFQ